MCFKLKYWVTFRLFEGLEHASLLKLKAITISNHNASQTPVRFRYSFLHQLFFSNACLGIDIAIHNSLRSDFPICFSPWSTLHQIPQHVTALKLFVHSKCTNQNKSKNFTLFRFEEYFYNNFISILIKLISASPMFQNLLQRFFGDQRKFWENTRMASRNYLDIILLSFSARKINES